MIGYRGELLIGRLVNFIGHFTQRFSSEVGKEVNSVGTVTPTVSIVIVGSLFFISGRFELERRFL